MKFSRNGRIIQIEVEPTDFKPGADLELCADSLMTGMAAILPFIHDTTIELSPEAEAARDKALEDLKERWELT